jgi:glycosidase
VSYDDVLEQIADEESLLNYYRQVISIKNTYRELYAGTLKEIDSDNNKIQAYTVTLGDTTTLVIHNTGSEQVTINLTNVAELLTSISVSGSDTTLQDGTATLPGQSTTLLRLNKSTTSIS